MTDKLTKDVYFHKYTPKELKSRKVVYGEPSDGVWTTAKQLASIDLSTDSYCFQGAFFDEPQRVAQIPYRWWARKLPIADISDEEGTVSERVARAYAHEPSRLKWAGYGWCIGVQPAHGGMPERRRMVEVFLDDILRGTKQFKYEVENLPPDWKESKEPYGVSVFRDAPYAALEGAIMNTTVSRTAEKADRAKVSVIGIPFDARYEGTMEPGNTCCPGTRYRAQKFDETRLVLDKHFIDGLLKAAYHDAALGGGSIRELIPLLYPTQPLADLNRALELTWVRQRINGKVRERAITIPEREAVIYARVQQLGGFTEAFNPAQRVLKLDWHTAD